MRASLLAGAVILALLVRPAEAIGQPPPVPGKAAKGKDPQGPPDEDKEILKEIKEAYKAPFEVHEDVLKELRRLYQQPSPDREAKIFKELRRLYQMTAEQEAGILQEIRKAYQRPSAEQEARVFQEIQRAEPLPPGTVPPSVQAEQARKIFQKLDRNGDGLLSHDELPESLRGERARWDANRDGFIDAGEYAAYYQGRLRRLSEQVASGEIELTIGGRPVAGTAPTSSQAPRPAVYRPDQLPPGLPDWFIRLDTDRDAQIGLYEWKKSGWPLEVFSRMDRNGDGFITIEELMYYLAQQPGDRGDGPSRAGTPAVSVLVKR